MGQYLRDKEISHIAIDNAALSRLVDVIAAQGLSMPEYNPPQVAGGVNSNPAVKLSYLIRFDEKGYRVSSKTQLLRLFDDAAEVERVILELLSDDAATTNRITGSYMDLRLDTNETAVGFLTVSSDDEGWMRACFAAVEDVLSRCDSRTSYWARHPIVDLALQLTAVFVGFIASLWGASKISPYLTIENAFLISFLLVLLVFSNLWVPIANKARQLLRSTFPKVRFDRPAKDKLAWFYRSVVTGLVLASALYILGLLFTYAGKVLGAFITTGA